MEWKNRQSLMPPGHPLGDRTTQNQHNLGFRVSFRDLRPIVYGWIHPCHEDVSFDLGLGISEQKAGGLCIHLHKYAKGDNRIQRHPVDHWLVGFPLISAN